METNVRLVNFGNRLLLIARKVEVSLHDLSIEQLQTLCTMLKKRGIAAVPFIEGGKRWLLTEERDNVPHISLPLSSDDRRTVYKAEVRSTEQHIRLEIADVCQRKLIEDLYLRRLQLSISSNTDYVTIQKSPNQFYEPYALPMDDDIDTDVNAFRRFSLFTQYFEGVGLGLGVDVGTSYYTKPSVEEFFMSGNQRRFFELKERQSTEYKGTLLYHGPNGFSRCYWDKWCEHLTLATTPGFTFEGKSFDNSYDYFKKLHPHFDVSPSDAVAYVSFAGFGTYPVPAKYLFLSVSTENLSDDVNQQDKYKPQQKRNLIDGFWQRVGSRPFGQNYQNMQSGYYIPDERNNGTFELPTISFADGQKLFPPKHNNPNSYKRYFIEKYHKLKENGCYYVPPTLEREIHFVFPENVRQDVRQLFSSSLMNETSTLTKKELQLIEHSYGKDEQLEIIFELKNDYKKGTVVFVFDNTDPSIYYTISQELEGWKIIRLTKQELIRKVNKFRNHPKGKGHWESYISLNAFRVVTELGCVPYMFTQELHYKAQLVIDVSENYSYFGLGLLIHSTSLQRPVFDYIVRRNPDSRNDLINPYFLAKFLKELLLKHVQDLAKAGATNLLVLRDGQENKSEYDVFIEVIRGLQGKLPQGFDFAFIDYRKKIFKSVRLFEDMNGEYKNPLEGSWLTINKSSAELFNTGEGTLTQGTANPILVKSNYKEVDLRKVLHDIFLTSQLNFGSPRVAQRLTYLAKRVDDLLREKRAQEVTKIK